jgi:hypothetical protein
LDNLPRRTRDLSRSGKPGFPLETSRFVIIPGPSYWIKAKKADGIREEARFFLTQSTGAVGFSLASPASTFTPR